MPASKQFKIGVAVGLVAWTFAVAALVDSRTANPIGATHAALQSPPASVAAATPAAATAGVPMAAMLPDFSALVERNGPAVVNISTMQKGRNNAAAQLPFKPGDPLHEFFRRFQAPEAGAQPVRGIGSGFIVSSDGYVLTNAHVVADATEVTVRLTDKREFQAKVIGADKRTDVALIKVNATGLPVVRIGDPTRLKAGEWVAAIGSPFGLENTVTAGIVSAKSRSLPDGTYVPFIQTDVAINPGNSGGPLFNLNGEVIGINSQIYSRSGGYMGLSFSIPIDVAMNIKDQLQKFGKASHGRIGVAIQPMTRDLAESFGMARPQGALVSNVEPGGPAAKAGLQSGDVVVGVNGKTVEDASDLPRLIGEMRPGTRADIKVWRKGGSRDLAVVIGEQQADRTAAAPAESTRPTGGKLGLAVRPLTSEERSAVKDDGLVVEGTSGPAAAAGIQQGDIIIAINGESVKSIEHLRRMAEGAKGKIALLVQRAEARMYVPLNVG
jgi:serine protease Do